MDLAIAAAVFPVIFVGELPDKTMFASLLLSTRGHPLAVWVGVATAFLVHVVIATTAGVALFHLLPVRVVRVAVALLFLAGAAFMLWELRGERIHARRSEDERLVERELATHRQVALAAFSVVFVAEWGDLTQVLTANLAAHYHDAISVGVGAVAALWCVAALAVVGGRKLTRYVSMVAVRWVAVAALLGFAGYTGTTALR